MVRPAGRYRRRTVKRDTLAWWDDVLIALWVWLAALLFLLHGDGRPARRVPAPPRS